MSQAPPTTRSDANAPRGPSSFIDPGTLMRIKSLELRAKVVVEGFLNGLHRSPYHGFSVEFSEYRQYSPGDDLRYLDWRLYARSDRYYIKKFEDETNLRCYLLVDLSQSMGFGSQSYAKVDYARTAAATLAYFLMSQRDAVGAITFDEQIGDYLPPRFRPGQLHRLMTALDKPLSGKDTDLAVPLEQIAKTVAKRGLIVLVSDLLAPLDGLERNLRQLRSHGHEVVLMRVLDPAERNFTFDQPSMFHDLETGRDLYVDPEATRDEYLRRFNEHEQQLEELCGSLGVDIEKIDTDQPLELSLYDFLTVRLRRGRQVMRKGLIGGQSAGRGA